MHTVERMEIPAWLIGLLGCVREIVGAVVSFDNDLPMRLKIVGAQEQFLSRGEEDIPVFKRQLKVMFSASGKAALYAQD